MQRASSSPMIKAITIQGCTLMSSARCRSSKSKGRDIRTEGTVKTTTSDTMMSSRQTNRTSPMMAASPTKIPMKIVIITEKNDPRHPRRCCAGCLSSTTTSARFCGVTSLPSISSTCLGVSATGMAMASTK